jgi:fatty acid amide hydrolase
MAMRDTTTHLTELGAAELARLIASGAVSSREVVAARIARIAAVNPKLNAVVAPRFEEALAEAAAADAAQARGESRGPLHGVPVTLKECFDLAGTPSTFGLPQRATHRATADDPYVVRLRRAGAIVLGKTNVPQLLLYIESDNPVYGRTSNPWNLDRTPGGSSGGEGAIIAAGGSPLGLGSDLGGSIRFPAHFCGIHGLKPTSGRLNFLNKVLLPGMEGVRDQAGPLARRVETSSAGLPVGVQVAARHWREDIVLAIMAALEEHFRAQPDYPAHPPI